MSATLTATITDAARRITEAHNALIEQHVVNGKLACDVDGEGATWWPEDKFPIADVVFPVNAQPITEREAQDWLDSFWRAFNAKMAERYGPIGALVYHAYSGEVRRVEKYLPHDALALRGYVVDRTVAHPRTRSQWYGGRLHHHATELSPRDEILELPVALELSDEDAEIALRLIEAGWSITAYASGLVITDPRGETYDSLRSADLALPLVA